jgi:hypothetical protein
MIIKRIMTFTREIIILLFKRPWSFNFSDLMRYFPVWRSSLAPGRNPLCDNVPWIAFAASNFLENILHKDMLVYEYGSGGSTLFFAERTREVISTEHNKEWYEVVLKEIIKKGIANCHLRLFEPEWAPPAVGRDIADPDSYISDDEKYRGMSFKKYASSIDGYPDGRFDIVLIDGRSRPSCFKHAHPKVKNGGFLILDNAETPYYSYIHKTLANGQWKKYDFYGLFPYIQHFSETCIWQKLAS